MNGNQRVAVRWGLALALGLVGACTDDSDPTPQADGSSDGASEDGRNDDGAPTDGQDGSNQDGSGDGGSDGKDGEDEPEGRVISFSPSTDTFLSPERGFYTTTNLATVRDLSYVREEGKTLVYAAVHLDDYLGGDHTGDLPAQVFTDVQDGFDAVRDAGVKAVVRFQYDNGEGYPGGANDATEAAMTRHIQQLGPVLAANEDVIFVLQSGMIGAWGEWHTSNNFIDGPDGKDARARILSAQLAAWPASRRVSLRYPAYKRMFYGETPSEVIGAGDDVRVAHLNDCFVSSTDDVGTYQYEEQSVLEAYLEHDTRAVPIGGETCATDARNACDVTLAEMTRFHWTYINDQYHPDVLARWRSEGCRPEIEQRLGYRLRLETATLPEVVAAGQRFTVALDFANDGFAALTNARPMRLVFTQGTQRHVVDVEADLRTFLPGTHTASARVTLPSEFTAGDVSVRLWLPDAAPTLETRVEYTLRLANEGLWDETTGEHALATLRIE